MNILYLANHLNVGGITSYVFSLSIALKARGHNIYVASGRGELTEKFIREAINYIPVPMRTKSELSPKILISSFKLCGIIRDKGIGIIHSNSRTTQVLGCLLSSRMRIPHVSTCHGFFKKRLGRFLFPCWGDRIIAISEEVRGHLVKDFRVSEDKIRLVHSGIDTDKFRVSARINGGSADHFGGQSSEFRVQSKEKLGLGAGPVIGIIARLSEEKGHAYLIKAMKVVLEDVAAAQLVIAGEGKMKDSLLDLTKELGIEKQVFFIPSLADTRELLPALDIFVLPSLKEGLGLSLMEAMGCGLAVIGSDTGGIKSLIQDNYNGLLVKPQDVAGLSRQILRLLNNPDEARRLGTNASGFIKENFSLEKMASQTEKVYLECLNAYSSLT